MSRKTGPDRTKPLTPFGVALELELERSGRFENNLTALAQAAGTNYRTLYNYMVKGTAVPGPVASALATALGIPVDRLLRPQPATHVERDDEVTQALQQFLAGFDPDDPQGPTDAEVAWLRGLSFRELRLAGLQLQPSLYGRVLREKRLQDSGRISRGLEATAPASDDTLDLPEPPRRR